MSADALLDELAAAGIHLVRDGDALFADVEDGTDFAPYQKRIREHQAELIAAQDLQERIIAAVNVDPEDFDRAEYDRLRVRWHALERAQ